MKPSKHKHIHLGKSLSWLLRHGALLEGLNIGTDGYMSVQDLLNCKTLKNVFTLEDIERVVELDNKQRFTLRNQDGALQICANQGHSIPIVKNLELIPLSGKEEFCVIHGTYHKNWHHIQKEGINRMKRNHIHFSKGLPGDKKVISGMRSDAEIFIFINITLAISDNIPFYMSVNGVILSPGNDRGVVEPKYFAKVCDKQGQILL